MRQDVQVYHCLEDIPPMRYDLYMKKLEYGLGKMYPRKSLTEIDRLARRAVDGSISAKADGSTNMDSDYWREIQKQAIINAGNFI